MSHANVEQPGEPTPVARLVTYLAGFGLGVLAVGVGIAMLIMHEGRTEIWFGIIGLGLALMGQGGIATMFVPGVRER